jgi:hypothetical protein
VGRPHLEEGGERKDTGRRADSGADMAVLRAVMEGNEQTQSLLTRRPTASASGDMPQLVPWGKLNASTLDTVGGDVRKLLEQFDALLHRLE